MGAPNLLLPRASSNLVTPLYVVINKLLGAVAQCASSFL